MLDEIEYFSPYGIPGLIPLPRKQPYVFSCRIIAIRVNYLPAVSDTGIYGGDSNWRRPIWMPVNALLIRALLRCYYLLWR